MIPPVLKFLEAEAVLVALIKPQFEAGRELASKGRVIRDPSIHEEVCVVAQFTAGLGLKPIGIIRSPILGPKGNREFLMAAVLSKLGKKHADSSGISRQDGHLAI